MGVRLRHQHDDPVYGTQQTATLPRRAIRGMKEGCSPTRVFRALIDEMQDARVRTGETSEVERVYREQGARIWRALLAFSGDADVASDSVAEAFAQALARGRAVRDVERWIWRASFKIAAGELQRRRRSSPVLDSDRSPYEMEVPARELVLALRRLSDKQRAAIVLHHAADYPIREVAAILGSTPGAVKVHLARGRRHLREQLGDDPDD